MGRSGTGKAQWRLRRWKERGRGAAAAEARGREAMEALEGSCFFDEERGGQLFVDGNFGRHGSFVAT